MIPFLIPLHNIRVKPNIPAGMDPCVVLGFVPKLRKTNEDWAPILVRSIAQDDWLLLDGRHRWVASLIAGRSEILAIEEVGQ